MSDLLDVLYNEIDPYAARWLRSLGEAGHISAGRVEERSIKDLVPADIVGIRRAHFFAGIGVWEYALRLAGFPESVNVWTGSCPCQPYSVAGLEQGVLDPRHLWPDWFRLIDVCRPSIVLGEQVASKAALGWLDLVCADLEGAGYSVGAADLPVAGVGAPHKRSRLYFCAYSDEFAGGQGREVFGRRDSRSDAEPRPGPRGGGVARAQFNADAHVEGRQQQRQARLHGQWPLRDDTDGRCATERGAIADRSCVEGRPGPGEVLGSEAEDATGLERAHRTEHGRAPLDGGDSRRAVSLSKAESSSERSEAWRVLDVASAAGATVNGREREREGLEGFTRDVNGWRGPGWLDPESARSAAAAGATRGYWGGCDWYFCRDGKYRPIGPGLFPLAHGAPARVGRLRAYGNAISAPLAAEFIRASLEAFGGVNHG